MASNTATASDPYTGFGADAGYRTDSSTGLELLGHRYYDPANGRFINRDPIGYDGGIGLYGYCYNSPNFSADPSGYGGDDDEIEDPIQKIDEDQKQEDYNALVPYNGEPVPFEDTKVGRAIDSVIEQGGGQFISPPGGGSPIPVPNGAQGPFPTRNGNGFYY